MEKDYIGLTVKEAAERAKSEEFIFRVVKQDGIIFVVTCDLRLNRLNFEIENNKITNCYIG